jgi:murein DD-endopeptidase MepM/ murein hydrolase activator NlpD
MATEAVRNLAMTIVALLIALPMVLALMFPSPDRVNAQAAPTPLVITTPTSILPTPTPVPTATLAAPTRVSVSESPPSDGMHPHEADHQFYAIQTGDTLLTVALEVGLDLEQAFCLLHPSFTWDQPLVISDRLPIPDPGTICHEVKSDDTIASIAEQYQRLPQQITEEKWNELIDLSGNQRPLTIGHHLRIPPTAANETATQEGESLTYAEGVLPLILNQGVNANIDQVVAVGKIFSRGEAPAVGGVRKPMEAPVPKDWPFGSGRFSWPIYGWLTQGYRADHRAVDVAAPTGTAVTAADRGIVIRAGWNNQGYGHFVIVDHNIDYITLYAHLSEVLVEEGEIVAAGQVLGQVGSTGNSTGPHLHFEIRDFGRRVDPLAFLMQ